ncbi:hypothetical protein [Clostridium tagluense]|uniref:hypothetical protein n=1 Tax=Clostridium tagluense TaxID=360422 RepID=UPI001C0D2F84|nr:hypothetical protein [Clostridium tagluense]MBU3129709.1 hypothetical protein [Clostridium tagluense]
MEVKKESINTMDTIGLQIKTASERFKGLGIDPNIVVRFSAVDAIGLQIKTASERFKGLGIDPNIVARFSAVDAIGLQIKTASERFKGLGIDPNIVARFSAVDAIGLQIKTASERFKGLGIDPNIVARFSVVDAIGLQIKTASEKFKGLGIDPNIVARFSAIDAIGLQIRTAAERFKEIDINDIKVNEDGTINYDNENIDVNNVISDAIAEINNCLTEEKLFNRTVSRIINSINSKNPLIVFLICFYIILPLFNNILSINLMNTSETKVAKTFISQNITSSKKYAKTIQKKYKHFSTENPYFVNLAMYLALEPIKKLYADYGKKRLEMKLVRFLFIFKKKSNKKIPNKKELNNFKKESIKSIRQELDNKILQQNFLDEYRFVNSDNIEIRNDCSLKSQTICKLQLGQNIKILYKNNHWSLVEFSKNNEIIKGWIATHHLSRFD